MTKSVLITGVSSGIGHGLAEEYLSRDARVYGVSRRNPERLLAEPGFSHVAQDLSQFDEIGDALSKLLGEARELDLVILNAGMLGELSDMKEASLRSLRTLMDVNVWSNKVVLDWIFESGLQPRQVVAISSGAAINGNRGWSGYAISKAALNMLTQLYAAENPRVHFTALAPGLVDTAMQDYLCGHDADDRFPSLENLKSRRHTDEMPGPRQAGTRLRVVLEQLPEVVQSGDFADVRQLGLTTPSDS